LSGPAGIECRSGGTLNAHQIVFKFGVSVTVTGASVTPASGGTGELDGPPVTSPDGEVTVNLKKVSNAQTIAVTLLGVNDGTNKNDVSVQMGVLVGDVNSTRRTDSGDVTQVRNHTVSVPDQQTFRFDVNASGRIDAGDVTVTRNASVTVLPP
jgi:hypothetical protein